MAALQSSGSGVEKEAVMIFDLLRSGNTDQMFFCSKSGGGLVELIFGISFFCGGPYTAVITSDLSGAFHFCEIPPDRGF